MKDKVASVIRIVSVPPIMVIALVLILYAYLRGQFATVSDCIILVVLLGIFPLLAYISPYSKSAGRDAQRQLAFIFTLFGYTIVLLWSFIVHSCAIIRSITLTYFLGIVILTILNKFVHFKASGHACGVTASILLLVFYADWKLVFPGVIFTAAVCWSSVYLKRHTLSQFIAGMITAMAAFFISILFIFILSI